MEGEPRFFGPQQLREIQRALALAEELCGDHYHLSAFDLRSAPYDVVTGRELIAAGVEPPPQPSQLAEVRRCDLTREERTARDRRRTHYRICLWDPHILAVFDRGERPGAVLLFVLVHELVHVVRFAKRLALFESGHLARVHEEAAVHETTGRILARAREPGLAELLRRLPELGSCLRGLEP
ncbi:MAG: hypothetical protein JXR83_14610 [Deltaproteobacteria bacterium]|nr:hypothetical protein [Deltaproteobacteria bacterium]